MTSTLFTLSSRQIWPQVLSTLKFRPSRLVLFHTDEKEESFYPSERLKTFLESSPAFQPILVELRRISHDDFSGIIDALSDAAVAWTLDGTNCRVNLTGGNKLMAMAAAEWCRLNSTPCFYLERNRRLIHFESENYNFKPGIRTEEIHIQLAHDLEPLGLLRCQLSDAEVVHAGERLTLRENGRNLHDNDIRRLLPQSIGKDYLKFLNCEEMGPRVPENVGDGLEYATALILLRLGVPMVQRGIHLRPKSSMNSPRNEGELDLVFNWKAKLWTVDCKDRLSAESRIEKLRNKLLSSLQLSPTVKEDLDKLEEELRAKDLHPLKEDLLSISEVGGLLGKVVCVRREKLPDQAVDYARSRRIEVVLKDQLIPSLKRLLEAN